MNNTLSIWFKRIASLFSGFIGFCFCMLSYFSIFYSLHIKSQALTCIAVSCFSLIAIIVMLYSRKQILTILASIVMIPSLLPVLLFYYGNWSIIIPLGICALFVFFFSGLRESPKTVLGIVYLLLYVIASLVYFVASMMFSTQIDTKVVGSGVSESKLYKYEIVDSSDSSNGSTAVYVEPNDKDYDFKLFKFTINGYQRDVYSVRPVSDKLDIKWKTESRKDITEKILDISKNITLNLDDEQKSKIGYSSDEKVYLSKVSDEDLAKLGVAESGDVLYINDKPCFRYYIADLEGYFSKTNRRLSFF